MNSVSAATGVQSPHNAPSRVNSVALQQGNDNWSTSLQRARRQFRGLNSERRSIHEDNSSGQHQVCGEFHSFVGVGDSTDNEHGDQHSEKCTSAARERQPEMRD